LDYNLEFEEVDHCGGNIFLNDDNATTIYSPSFPLNYEQGLDCVWSIQSDMYVEIEILSVSLQMSTSLNDLQKVFSLLTLPEPSGPTPCIPLMENSPDIFQEIFQFSDLKKKLK
jgi:hypothetical protein